MTEPRIYHEAIPYSQRTLDEKTADVPAGEVRHLTSFDRELVSGMVELGAGFSHGRRLARGDDGALYLVTESASCGIVLSGAANPAPRSECFFAPVVLVGIADEGLLGRAAGVPGGAGLAPAADGSVALAWHDDAGVWLARGAANAGTIQWDRPLLVAEHAHADDLGFDPAGALHLLYDSPDGLFHAVCAGTCQAERIADTGCEAVMAISAGGDVHVAYQLIETHPWQVGDAHGESINESIRYRCRAAAGWEPEEQVAWPITMHPAIALWRDWPLIVFQTEGIRRVQPRAADYMNQREGGGSGVGFALRGQDGQWQVGAVAKPEEIIVADGRGSDVFEGRIYPMVEEMHRPRLGVDRHGVPWAVWPNTTRRHTCAARWLGRAFSAPFEVRGGWYALSTAATIAGDNASRHLDIAVIAADRVYYTPVVVPALTAGSTDHILFLDLREIAEMDGLEQSLGRLERYPGNPVFTPDRPGTWDDCLVAGPTVWRDGDRCLMQYVAKGTLLPNANVITGLAESRDGIRWTRPRLNVIPLDGQPENNCIPWVIFFRDDEEPDPQKRYKGARTNGLWTVDPRRTLMVSPDAVHWTEVCEMVNMHCLHEAGGPTFRDPYDVPERRFKAIGRTCCDEGRGAGMMWSADCIHWEGYEAFLDIDDPYGKPAAAWRGRYNAHRYLHGCGERRGQGQIYWNTVWIEHGLYLGLYSPMHWDGGYDMALAVSRDGYGWTRVCGGKALLEREPVGMRESGCILVGHGNARPVRFGDRLRVYYSSTVRHHGTEPHGVHTGSGISFADLRPDGWACLRLQRGCEQGFFTTVPIEVPAGEYNLRLNAASLTPSAGAPALTVEALDAQTARPLPGYTAAVIPLPGLEETSLPVEWPTGPLTGPALIRLRFTLRSLHSRLYAFWFEPAS